MYYKDPYFSRPGFHGKYTGVFVALAAQLFGTTIFWGEDSRKISSGSKPWIPNNSSGSNSPPIFFALRRDDTRGPVVNAKWF